MNQYERWGKKRAAGKEILVDRARGEDDNDLMLSPLDVKLLKETFVVKEEFNKFRDQVMTMFDKVTKELLAIREESAIFDSRFADQEDRIEVPEAVHPHGRHAA